MKKLFLTLSLITGFGIAASAQTVVTQPDPFSGACAVNSTSISTPCGSGCYSAVEIDQDNMAILRPLTNQESATQFIEADSRCRSTRPGLYPQF
jgi:hypothetical protein